MRSSFLFQSWRTFVFDFKFLWLFWSQCFLLVWAFIVMKFLSWLKNAFSWLSFAVKIDWKTRSIISALDILSILIIANFKGFIVFQHFVGIVLMTNDMSVQSGNFTLLPNDVASEQQHYQGVWSGGVVRFGFIKPCSHFTHHLFSCQRLPISFKQSRTDAWHDDLAAGVYSRPGRAGGLPGRGSHDAPRAGPDVDRTHCWPCKVLTTQSRGELLLKVWLNLEKALFQGFGVSCTFTMKLETILSNKLFSRRKYKNRFLIENPTWRKSKKCGIAWKVQASHGNLKNYWKVNF